MKGDYFRYLAEVATGNDRKEIMNQSQEAYKGAFEVAQKEMPVSNDNLVRLSFCNTHYLANSSNPLGFGIKLFRLLLWNPQRSRAGVQVSYRTL